jgi:predicted GNAT family acetyltransferase
MNYIKNDNHIYSLNEQGVLLAEVKFPLNGKYAEINRTFVDPSLRGQGVANDLLVMAYESIKNQGLKAVPTCSYAVTWFKRNKDKHDILATGIDLDDPTILLKEECAI